MTASEQRVLDIEALPPEDKVAFMLKMVENLRDEVKPTLQDNRRLSEFLSAIDGALEAGARWVKGLPIDGKSLLYPVYNDDGADVADLELEEHEPGYNNNITMVGSLATVALLYAANVQLRREGTKRLPHPFEQDYDDALLVHDLETDRGKLDADLKAKFDEIWDIQFRSGGS